MEERIGKRIRERRKALHMNQKTLATVSNVSRATISALENGKYKNVLIGTLTAIASALDTTVEFFFS